jgi:Fic family protein
MARFLEWFNHGTEPSGLIRSGLAHFWFVTIHPFDDGNGRIARAIADQVLAQAEQSSQRFYSMSAQLRAERSQYYAALESAQKGMLDVTDWLVWFLECFSRAVDGAGDLYAGILRKATFWERHAGQSFSDRQRKVINRVLDGFEGKLTAKKWSRLTRTSVPTAQRDINDLIQRGILRRSEAGGRSTSYELAAGSASPS